jgi:hypothetical protein
MNRQDAKIAKKKNALKSPLFLPFLCLTLAFLASWRFDLSDFPARSKANPGLSGTARSVPAGLIVDGCS